MKIKGKKPIKIFFLPVSIEAIKLISIKTDLNNVAKKNNITI
jgi:hypothetical protein